MVCAGETFVVPEDRLDWEPTALSMLTVAAPAMDQDNADVWPAVMDAGEALKLEIAGAVPPVQAMVKEGVTVMVVGLAALKVRYE